MSRLRKNDHIIIVGSGCIGLATAYSLAKRSLHSSTSVKISVVEASDKPFAAASSSNTGCLHYGFPESHLQPILPLGKYSFDLWAAEAQNERFRAATGYRAQSSFGIDIGSGRELDKLPEWVRTESFWDVDHRVLGAHTATMSVFQHSPFPAMLHVLTSHSNPVVVGQWLTGQCLAMGVEILTGLNMADVSLSPEDRVQSVTCTKKDQTTVDMACDQILLACGPWTPGVFERLFPSSPLRLQWTTDAGDWIICKSSCPTTQTSTAYVSFANLAGHKMEFSGRSDGTIWACGRRNFTADLPVPGQVDEPDGELIEELSSYARKWLHWGCNCAGTDTVEFQILSKGRAFRPATKSGLPIISEVSRARLSSDDGGSRQAGDSSSGVFVCWGHGSYGLTLGMGSGRLMSQLMYGDKPDLDLSLFSLD